MPNIYPNLLKQIAGGFLWGLFFILAPFELLFFGAVIWLPVLAWRERRRIARYGFKPGAIWRVGTVAAMVALAAVAPVKHEDRRVGPFAGASASLGELARGEVIYQTFDPDYDRVTVALPSSNPTRRQVIRAINAQTDFCAGIMRCGNGATILFGGGGGRIHVFKEHRKQPDSAGKPDALHTLAR